jgi:hypothetical protein
MDEQTQARADRFKDWMGVLVAVVALVTAITAWRAAAAARIANFEDYYALTASLNTEQARMLTMSKAIEHLTAFTQFTVNDELLAQFLNAGQKNLSDQERAVLASRQEEAERLATTDRNFFPVRYANQDGTYAIALEIAERLADEERYHDLNPQPHLDESGAQDTKTYTFIQIVVLLGIALLAFTLAGAFHYERPILRWSSAAVGAVCLGVSVIAMLIVEFG